MQRAEEAANLGVRIYTVGIGSPEGAPIPDAQGGMKKDRDGNVVISKLDEVTLSQIAGKTGGIYMRAATVQSGLKPIMDDLDRLQRAELEQVVYSSYDEQYQLAFGLSFFFFVISFLIFERKHTWFNIDKLFREK